MQQRSDRYRLVIVGLLAALVATTLGGCALFFPKKTPISGGAAQPGRIEGRLVDETGRPVVGARAIIPEAGQATAVSGVDGKVSLTGLAPGTWYVRVNKEGYLAGSFAVNVEGAGTAQFQAELALTAGNLHKGGTPNLCADCHVLHDPTPTSHLLNGATPNSPCFAAGCHAAGGAGPTLDEPTYRNSPHGPAWTYNSNTQQAWTGQSTSERGNCNTCHEPHGISGPPFMLKKGVKDLDGTLHLNDVCYECHTNQGTGNTVNWPGMAVYQGAANLHVNPGAVPPSTLRTYPGLKYAMGDCGNCHVPHGKKFGATNDPHMLRDQGYKLCLKCHTDKTDTNGTGHNGNCVVCHDPHNVTKTGALLNVKNPATGTSTIPVPKESYRAASWTAVSYCTGCHQATPPSWLPVAARNPYAASTRFWNQSSFYDPRGSGRLNDQNLHNVHVNRVWVAAWNQDPWRSHSVNHYGYDGDNNRVRCGLCHTAHQTPITRQLSPGFVTSVSGTYSGNWTSKAGCGVQAGCHTCEWCHYAPGNPGWSPGEACYQCGYHGYWPHAAIDY